MVQPGLPTFLVIGAMKAGTTSLYAYLAGHPDVFMPALKEPHFFSRNWDRGIDWYRELFRPGEGKTIIGEASTTYSKAPAFPNVPGRIAELVPEAKLVYLVRQPVERMRSHYLHNVLMNNETQPIDNALIEDPNYLQCSRYGFQIDQYLEWFRRDQLLVVRAEHLRDGTRSTVERVLSFIGAEPARLPPLALASANETAKRRRPGIRLRLLDLPGVATGRRYLPAGVRRRLRETLDRPLSARQGRLSPDVADELWSRLRTDITRLEELTGESFEDWRTRVT